MNLDLNGNGVIGYVEMQKASPVAGKLSVSNQPLIQYYPWPRDASGKPLPLKDFPTVKGIPGSLYDYLVAHPEADPAERCERRESAVRFLPRVTCRSAWRSILAPSVTAGSTCDARQRSNAISKRNS